MKLDPHPENATFSQNNLIEEKILWFPIRNRKRVIHEVERLKSVGIRQLKVGVDCIEFNTKKGMRGYDWLIPLLADSFDLELCFDNFPMKTICGKAPKHWLPEIVEHFIFRHGDHFDNIQLCRQSLDRAKHPGDENIFAEDMVFSATWARYLGKKVCLGKIQPGDFEWISKLVPTRFFAHIDSIEIDNENGDLGSNSAKFYERALQSLFHAKGVDTKIRCCQLTSTNLNLSSTRGIAC
ncbi:hypothetical protein LZF95_18865 [Algoriphagus sp. AGSA1]|uniref:hypothetical protein n=1 Tax=Algoriphagus sp. AGSA1 TaxID=2907213 RepID=UPI001F288CDF|nr:hypothetical protein [Algoriphagus sp. AGSA1]MCE7056752.1 hypothetical protein [Algoriphagus sp. AGSA1]